MIVYVVASTGFRDKNKRRWFKTDEVVCSEIKLLIIFPREWDCEEGFGQDE